MTTPKTGKHLLTRLLFYLTKHFLTRLYVEQYRLIQMLLQGTGVMDVTDSTDIIMNVTDIADIADVADVMDVTDITDVAGAMDVTDITGGTVRHMASY